MASVETVGFMSDRENEPTDLFDAVCRLDDLAEWLKAADYPDEAERVTAVSDTLKGYVVVRIKP